MSDVAAIFLKWWETMALLYERYGGAVDVEEKPEWAEVLQLQRGWLEQLGEETGSDQEILFEKVQAAIDDVLGTSDDVAVSLTALQADTIIHRAIELVAAVEATAATTAGRVN